MATVAMATPTIAAARSSAAPPAPPAPQAEPRTDTLEVVGKIPFPPSYNTSTTTGTRWSNQPTPMLVDPVHSLGFAVGMLPADDGMNYTENFRVAMYDLETLELLDTADPPMATTAPLEQILSWAIDPERGQIFTFLVTGGVLRCPQEGGVRREHTYFYERKNGRWQFRIEGSQGWPDRPSGRYYQQMPCGGPLGVHPDAGAVYKDPTTGRSKLYLTGVFAPDEAIRDPEIWKVPPVVKPDPNRSAGSSLVVSQLDLETLAEKPAEAIDWQIDLHKYGCGRRVTFFVGRAGPNVYTYCHDHSGENRYSPLGAQGYVVRIPLTGGMPRPTGCLPDDVRPSVPHEEAQEALACELVNPSDVARSDLSGAAAPALYDEVLNAEVRRIPTLPGFAQPFLDPASGRVLLLTDDPVNGSAVWVLDAIAERFIGVMTPGDAPPRQRQRRPGEPDPPGPTGAGFHSKLGRGYVYSVDGIVVASGRQDPPMAGTLHRVLSRTTHPLQRKPNDFRNRPVIAVAPELDRLFLPVAGEGYFVVEDSTLDPPTPPSDNVDRFTTQVDEQPDVTEANTSSEAEASGLHVVMAGGTSNVVNPMNPLCNPPTFASGVGLETSESDPNADPGDDPHPANVGYHLNVLVEDNSERAIFDGSCLAERVVSRGNRDFALGYATTTGGTSTGVEASGQGVAFSPSDSASDHDIRNAGECYRGSAHATTTDAADHLSSFSDEEDNGSKSTTTASTTTTTTQPGPFDTYRRACHEPQNGIREHDGGRTPDLNAGTQGRDGSGFPAPQARCTDSHPDDRRDAAGTDTADGGVFHARARCDGSRILGRATTSSVGLGVPDASDPTITVEQITSTVDTRRTSEDGVVSIAEAKASDVRIGPLHIGIVWSKATSKAHGRTDTAHGELKRAWCDVSVNGDQRFEGCRDPESDDVQSIVDAFNQTSQKVRLSVPEGHEEGTPGGYQGVVIKDPSVAAADQTVNEDDSLTVSGLQAVAYNDNAGGRSRVILQFAGVRSESTYGIVLLPQFSTPEFGTFGGFTTGGPARFASLPIHRPVYGVEARPPRFAEQLIVNDRAPPPESIFTPATRNPVLGVLQALEWLTQHPREAALLFLVFSILGLPVYLVARRRAFERALLE